MERRAEARTNCYAKALLLEHNIPGYVRDIAPGGCRIDFINTAPLQLNTNVQVKFIPSDEVNLPSFELTIAIKWQTQSSIYYSIGGTTTPPTARDKENLSNLLKYFNKLNPETDGFTEPEFNTPE